ncbi:hypothetical protein LSH36_583g01054 [Paralvinella palmiformis]|uniref:Nucleoside diphosphate kinase n=1 Tax=Paralvinella palmiformis TaxID=53620 RepID=A0AAD9MWJ8_9ANNE|nr:hypothetical protein LSH36_583g01054 [Paralvinella palmiformis]
MSYQRSFVMVKPGIFRRKIVGEIISRMEKKRLDILAMKMIKISPKLAQHHYHEHVDKSFFKNLLSYICSGEVLVMVVGGENAITQIRSLCGATKVEDAAAGSIRGDYAVSTTENVIHASDSPESAMREIDLFFRKEEIFAYNMDISQ